MVNNAVNGTVQICIPLRSVTAPRRDVLVYPAVDTGPELPVAPRVVKRYDIAGEKKVKTKASFLIIHAGTTGRVGGKDWGRGRAETMHLYILILHKYMRNS